MPKFRKKTVVVDAMQFKTNNEHGCPHMDAVCIWANQGRGMDAPCYHDGTNIYVRTPEGPMRAVVGDWIVHESQGGFYVHAEVSFSDMYEPVEP